MPNQVSKNSDKCGNSKCGTFAPAHVPKHYGGKHVLPGLHAPGRIDKAHHQVSKDHHKAMSPKKGIGHGTSRHSAYRDSDGDYD